MADLAITAANCVQGSGASVNNNYVAGETLTAGQVVYIKTSDGKLYKCDANVDAATASLFGVALNGASTGQPVSVQTAGPITIGATTVTGEMYAVSNTAGGICPFSDKGATDFVTLVGYGKSTTQIQLNVLATGLAHG